MKSHYNRLAGATLLSATALLAQGVPAKSGWQVYEQPDGTTIKLSHRGDERCSFFVTESGMIVRQDAGGFFRIVANDGSLTSLTPADYNVKASLPADYSPEQAFESLQKMAAQGRYANLYSQNSRMSAPQRVIPGGQYDNADGHDIRAIPTNGSPHVLVVLVDYADVKFSFASDPHTEMTRMMNEPGYSGFSSTGSARDFYTDQSRGQYTPVFDVYGPVQLSQNRSYYGANDAAGNDMRAYEMITEACTLLDDEVDFSIYDTNGDGQVDNVYVFYAGYGENSGGSSSCVWPHAWSVQYATTPPVLDGVKINRYACSNELNYTAAGQPLDPTGIGTFCHEFGHVLGQPDMYTTKYTNAFTPGDYSAMDHGSYNNNGRTPPNFSAYERYAMEWIKPIEITKATSISMLPLGEGGNVYKITPDPKKPTEYWLFENRQQKGWDTYIPGHGMLVWHIDYVPSVWQANLVNNTPNHQYVDLVEADNTQSEGSRAGDTFPGQSGIGSYTAATSPAFRTWTSVDCALPLTDITESAGGVISFNVDGGSTSDEFFVNAPAPKIDSCTDAAMAVSWQPVAGAEGYNVSVWSQMIDPLFGDIVTEFVPGYEFVDLGNSTSIELEGLEQSTTYVVQAYARSKSNVSQVGEARFNTFASTLEESVPSLSVAPNSSSAEMSWVAMPDATSYALTVATRAETTPVEIESASFDGNKYPAEWLFDGGWETRQDYCGNAAPSLKFLAQGSSILSGIYSEDIAEIDFWARVNRQNAQFSLDFYAVSENGSMLKFYSVTDLAGTKTGTNVKITDIPDGTRQWICIYNFSTPNLILYVDDVVIKARGTVTDTPVAGYDGRTLSETRHTVTGLQPSTEYVAWLTGSNSASTSRKSQVMRFRTLQPGSVTQLPADGSDAPVFTVSGGVVSTTSAESFDIFTTDGRVVALGCKGSAELPARGVYLIRCGGKASAVLY